MISELVRALDCCGWLRSWYHQLPSFADGAVDLDHRFDSELERYSQRVSFPAHLQGYNPAPQMEAAVFQQLHGTLKGNMLQRNALLLSRLFIKNADTVGLNVRFQNHARVRILDCISGNALNEFSFSVLIKNSLEILQNFPWISGISSTLFFLLKKE